MATVEDGGIETPISVSSPLPQVRKVDAGVRLMVSDTGTCGGRVDEETDPAVTGRVTPRRPPLG